MRRHTLQALAALAVCWVSGSAVADKITLRHSDYFEMIRAAGADTVLTFGNVRFVQDDAALFCDSAVWIKEVRLHLWGAVRYEADGNVLVADSLVYDLVDSLLYAVGDTVILISSEDSIRAVGSEAFYDRAQERIEMLGRPRVQFQYPDTVDGRDAVADYIRYEYSDQSAVAQGGVVLTQAGSIAHAACARFDRHPDRIRLYDSASVDWDNYRLIGEYIVLRSANGEPSRVDVWGGGEALLLDPPGPEHDSAAISIDSATGEILGERLHSLGLDSALSDSALELAAELAGLAPAAGARLASSRLVGRSLHFTFTDGDLSRIDAHGQAFSFYQPPSEDTLIDIENTASGDSISLYITHDSLKMVKVFGSVEGVYVERQRPRADDSLQRSHADTINYAGQRITFDLTDSTIALAGRAKVDQAQMALKSDSIHYQTARKFVTAFADTAAPPPTDSVTAADAQSEQSQRFGKVILSDGGEEVEGDYVEYSLATGKGLLLQSATQYDNAYYTGGELYRRNSEVFFVDEGSYTTCEFSTPHFHFWSKEMKVINND
ncbi:MAG TPA: OstA-like protein, partial [candidate division Zixibacteria bacterium]|nr:OstA-like protein [candidate division Zixibacteria bacterium]